MTPHDQQRFAKLVSEFIDGCGFEPPLYVIAIGANGSVSVSRHTDSDVEVICSHTVGPGLVSPITLAVVAADGRGKSARIEIGAERATMQ
jgi:hypothetical protein